MCSPNNSKRGAVLPIVIVLMAVFALLLANQYGQRSKLALLVNKEQAYQQANLMLEVAINKSRLKFSSNPRASFDSLKTLVRPDGDSLFYQLNSSFKGIWSYLEAGGYSYTGLRRWEASFKYQLSQKLDSLPAIVITGNHSNSLTLGKDVSIQGQILTYDGTAKLSTLSCCAAVGTSTKSILPKNKLNQAHPHWAQLTNFNFTQQEAYLITQLSELDSATEGSQFIENNPHDKTIIQSNDLIVDGFNQLRNVTIIAPRIIVTDEANLKNCILIAKTIKLSGQAQIGGEVLARDTLLIDLEEKQLQTSSFYHYGSYSNQAPQFRVTSFNGPGSFFYGGKNGSPTQLTSHVLFETDTFINGLILIRGTTEFRGALQGSLITHKVASGDNRNVLNECSISSTPNRRFKVPTILSKNILVSYDQE